MAAGCTTPRLVPVDETTDASGSPRDGGSVDAGIADAWVDAAPDASVTDDASACLPGATPCAEHAQCCGPLVCGTNLEGSVCCGNAGTPCATGGGEDCCGLLLCDTTASSGASLVCCAPEGEFCSAADGSECCGALRCVDNRCVP